MDPSGHAAHELVQEKIKIKDLHKHHAYLVNTLWYYTNHLLLTFLLVPTAFLLASLFAALPRLDRLAHRCSKHNICGVNQHEEPLSPNTWAKHPA